MSDRTLRPRLKSGARANWGYIALAFFASAGLMLFVWFCMGMIPFGGKTILRMDLYHQYGPLFAELYERLVAGRSLLYSWDSGLGGNFLGNFFNYLSSPTGLLVLLFGRARVPEAIGVMILLKCAFASGAFAFMLQKLFHGKGSPHGNISAAAASFGLLYSFCGWFIAYYWNVMWVDAMALLPLVALGIHSIVKERKFTLYSVSLAVTLVSSYYMGFMVCIFSALWFLALLFSDDEPFSLEPPAGKKRNFLRENRLLRSGLAFAFGSLLGTALAACALLPVYYALKSSSATSGSFPTSYAKYFSILDFLANHFPDVVPTIRSSGEDVLPNVYCGAATLLLVPLYLFAPKIQAREKVPSVLLLGLLFFSFNTNYLNYIWHAMHFPNDLPYRFSFLYCFLLLYLAYKAFLHLKDIPLRVIIGCGAMAVLFAVLVEKIGSKNVDVILTLSDGTKIVHYTTYLTIAFVAVYTLLLASTRKAPKKAGALALLLFCCVVIEVCAADTQNFEINQLKVNYAAGMEDFRTVKGRIEDSDDGFYRMEMTDLRTRMDPALFDYRGISTFSSMAYERTSNLESDLGLHSNYINSYTYNPNTPVYNAMHNLKYLVENQTRVEDGSTFGFGSSYVNVLSPALYLRRDEFTLGRYTVFQNRYPLSIAYWTANNLRLWRTKYTRNPFEIQMDYWRRATGVGGVFTPLELTLDESYYSADGLNPDVSGQYIAYSNKPAGSTSSIPCTVRVDTPQNVYIFVDASYASVHVTRPDGTVENRDKDHQAIFDLGMVAPEEPLSVTIRLSAEDAPQSGGFSVYVYGLNLAAFLEGYGVLAPGVMRVTAFSDTMLKGAVNAPRDGLLYTSIPYDEGWQVLIDGKRVPVSKYVGIGIQDEQREVKSIGFSKPKIEKYTKNGMQNGKPAQVTRWRLTGGFRRTARTVRVRGGLLGVPLAAGNHTVELRYVPQGYRMGLIISASALMLLGLCGLLGIFLPRRKRAPGTAAPQFSFEGLRPENFSLYLEEEPLGAEPEDDALPPFLEAGAGEPETEEAQAPPEDEDLPPPDPSFLPPVLPPPPEPPPEPPAAAAPDINTMLQEMQARAEQLRRKMRVEDSNGGDGQEFRLV